jgi:hypothetical protein
MMGAQSSVLVSLQFTGMVVYICSHHFVVSVYMHVISAIISRLVAMHLTKIRAE